MTTAVEWQDRHERVAAIAGRAKDTVNADPNETLRELTDLLGRLHNDALNDNRLLDLLRDRRGTGRLEPEERERIKELMAKAKLDDDSLDRLTSLLWNGYHAALYAGLYSSRHLTKEDLTLYRKAAGAALRAIMQKNPHWPPKADPGWSQAQVRSETDAAALRLAAIGSEADNWSAVTAETRRMDETAALAWRRHDPNRPWFDPATMTVTATDRAIGFNIVNPGDLPVAGSPEEILEKLEPRWKRLVEPADGGPAVSGLTIARMAIYATLPAGEANVIPQFDQPDWNYHIDAHDGTPLETQTRTRFLPRADINDPKDHCRALFGRNLTEIMQTTSLGSPQSATQLASELADAMHRLAEAGNALRRGVIDPPPAPGPMAWQKGIALAWAEAEEITNGWKLPEALGGTIQDIRERARSRFSDSEQAKEAFAHRNHLSFVELRARPTGGPGNVEAVFLRLLHRCLDYGEQFTFELAKGPQPRPQQDEDQEYTQEWRRAGAAAPEHTGSRLGHRRACLYDRTIRHIAHAGYIEAHLIRAETQRQASQGA